MFKRLIALLVCLTFSFSNLQYIHAQASPAGGFSINQLPVPGTMIGESAPFAPLALKGLVVNLNKPLEFQFIVDTGKGPQDNASIKEEANKLVKYFLAGLTIPEGELWVNLSPYEKNRITTQSLGQTELGRDLLAQDYILKQLTASLIYPEKDLGKEFWSRVYAKAQQQFGTTNIPVNTFNKVWILPDQAQVFENGAAAYVTKSTLKVMLDEDYLALQKHASLRGTSEASDVAISKRTTNSVEIASPSARNDVNVLGSQIIRQIVIPEITKEVNTGKNFAPLRQIYDAMILAKWYKETFVNGILDAVYTNKNKTAGVNLTDPAVKEQIYQRYLQAYKKGVFNYIKEGPTPDGQVVPRKYFSGGMTLMAIPLTKNGSPAMISTARGVLLALTISLSALTPSANFNAQQHGNSPQTSSVQIHLMPSLATMESVRIVQEMKPTDAAMSGTLIFEIVAGAGGGFVAMSLIVVAYFIMIEKKKIQSFAKGEVEVDKIIKLLNDESGEGWRKGVIENIDKFVTDPKKRLLIFQHANVIGSKYPDVRKAAREALDKLEINSDLQYKVGLAGLNSGYDDYIKWAIKMLAKSGIKKAIEPIVKELSSVNADVRQAARDTLDNLVTDSESQYQVGLAGLSSGHPGTNVWAIGMLKKSGKKEAEFFCEFDLLNGLQHYF